MVHPLNTGRFRYPGDPVLSRHAMPATLGPHEGMPMRVPVVARRTDRPLDRLPRREPSPLQRQRLQDLPPRLDQIQVGGMDRREDELERAGAPG